MIDPISLMATVTATYNGVKKAVALGREAHDIVRQLGAWAESADKMYNYINAAQAKKPGLFETVKFDKSESKEALNMAAARLQLQNMEAEIKTMFYYGELQELGQAGYSEFVQNRKRIREERQRILDDQKKRRLAFIDSLFWYVILAIVLCFAAFALFIMHDLVLSRGH